MRSAGRRSRFVAGFVALVAIPLGLTPIPAQAAPPGVVNVPADVATIQAAIDTVADGGTVTVSPGIYRENLLFPGKTVAVRSSGGPGTTVIDGGGRGPTVDFHHGETAATVLQGFTVRNGKPGINIAQASPTIVGNVVTGNSGSTGGGISLAGSQSVIRDNVIRGNTATWGGGLHLVGTSGAEIVGNTIEGNTAANGGGMTMNTAWYPLVWNNLFRGNHANSGGGLQVINYSAPYLVQNVFVGNDAAGQGGGVELSPAYLVPEVISNTFLGNTAPLGTAIGGHGDFFAANNVITGPPTGPAVYCDSGGGRYFYNDIYNGTPTPSRFCPDVTGIVGNVSVDPRLLPDFSLGAGSPLIDAGHDDVIEPELPPVDANGAPRVTDGNGDGVAIVDLGAFERPSGGWTPRATVSASLNFGTVVPGSPVTLTVTVTGTGRWTTHPGTPTVTAGANLSVAAGTCVGAILAATESCAMHVTYTPVGTGALAGTVTIPSDAGTFTVSVTGRAVDSTTARYLDQAYRDLLGRPPTAAEIDRWSPAVADFGGRVTFTVTLTMSPEFRSHRIATGSRSWLGHDPDPSDAAVLLDAITGGTIVEIAPVVFASSDEFYARSGGTPEGFVDALFQTVVGVRPDAAARSALADGLRAGYPRSSLAVLLILHPVARSVLVDAVYQRLLGHPAGAGIRAVWVDAMAVNIRSENVDAYVVATDEYWSRAIAG